MFEERGEGGLEWEELRAIVIGKKAGVRSEKKKWYSRSNHCNKLLARIKQPNV